MAADKLYWNELRRAVMERTDATEQEANAFLNALIEQIIEALKTEKQVRVNGLGIFRLQEMQPRKSVNIATGEEIVIDGYNKVVFAPEASVREMIGNNPTSTATPRPKSPKKKKDSPDDEELTPIQKLGQQADEIVGLLTDLGQKPNTGAVPPIETSTEEEAVEESAVSAEEETPAAVPAEEETPAVLPAEEESPKEPTPAEEKAEEEPATPTPAEKEAEVQPAEPQSVKGEKDVPATEETKAVEAEKPQTVVAEEKSAPIKEESAAKEPKAKQPKRKFHFFRDTLICVICLLMVLVCGYFFGRNALSNWVESLGQKSAPADTVTVTAPAPNAQETQEAEQVAEVITEDTTAMATIQKDSALETPATEITYSGYLATEQINEGSRLTWLAYRYYGNKALWVYIYDANKDHLTDPNHIQVGTSIRIPKLTAIQQDTTNAATKALLERLKANANARAK